MMILLYGSKEAAISLILSIDLVLIYGDRYVPGF